MNTLRRAVTGSVTKFLSTVGERQIRVIASDATPDRMGDILEPGGCQLDEFRRNPIMLAQHSPDQPIGRWPSIEVKNGRLEALGEFAPEGVSELADEYCALAKSGVIKAVSVGFIPISYEPLRDGGRRYTSWELLELSLVSVPANPNALVIERSYGSSDPEMSARAYLRRVVRAALLRNSLPPPKYSREQMAETAAALRRAH
jgi:HK97 family phage prohead protease